MSTPSKTCVLYSDDTDVYIEFKDIKVDCVSYTAVIFDIDTEHKGCFCDKTQTSIPSGIIHATHNTHHTRTNNHTPNKREQTSSKTTDRPNAGHSNQRACQVAFRKLRNLEAVIRVVYQPTKPTKSTHANML